MAHVPDVVELTKTLIAIPSPSQQSNQIIASHLATLLQECGFNLEQLSFVEDDQRKTSLIARKGTGEGGLGLFSHSDTVPADADGWEPFTPTIQDDRIIGRGAADMKGAIAASIVAAAPYTPDQLRRPVTVVITADEEIGYGGAKQVVAESKSLAGNWPTYGIIAEPTQMRPVYAHKGGLRVRVTAHGRAAHTSTDKGISANFLIAPFLADMAELNQLVKREKRFQNAEFDPPTNGFNMVINDGNAAANVTAAKTVCTVGFRPMPDDHREEVLEAIIASAKKHNLEFDWYLHEPFYVDRNSPLIQAALAATGLPAAETVPFGTEAAIFKDLMQLVILGPGNIAQAHTKGEWIAIDQLHSAVNVYRQLIDHFCVNS
ncbi:MAG: M20/M25/M40 family metallo-hydrolase [Caldilineaceae bacterium]|nr:M20/M25/M40 family metallo-hydrolase [Caldilineaceae bacterium]